MSNGDAPGQIEEIYDLFPGNVVLVPSNRTSNKKRLIVDDRPSRRNQTVPLLGLGGAHYHLEQRGELIHLNHYSPSHNQWSLRGTCTIQEIEVNPDL